MVLTQNYLTKKMVSSVASFDSSQVLVFIKDRLLFLRGIVEPLACNGKQLCWQQLQGLYCEANLP